MPSGGVKTCRAPRLARHTRSRRTALCHAAHATRATHGARDARDSSAHTLQLTLTAATGRGKSHAHLSSPIPHTVVTPMLNKCATRSRGTVTARVVPTGWAGGCAYATQAACAHTHARAQCETHTHIHTLAHTHAHTRTSTARCACAVPPSCNPSPALPCCASRRRPLGVRLATRTATGTSAS
jgi:hypothetical protein